MTDYDWNEILRGAVVFFIIFGALNLFGWVGFGIALLAFGAIMSIRDWWIERNL